MNGTIPTLDELRTEPTCLRNGRHKSPDEGMCLLEATAWVAGAKFGDRPSCVAPPLIDMGHALNDLYGHGGAELRTAELSRFVRPLIGTAGPLVVDQERAFMAHDWLARVCVPAWLDAARFNAVATRIRETPRVDNLGVRWDSWLMLKRVRFDVARRADDVIETVAGADGHRMSAMYDMARRNVKLSGFHAGLRGSSLVRKPEWDYGWIIHNTSCVALGYPDTGDSVEEIRKSALATFAAMIELGPGATRLGVALV